MLVSLSLSEDAPHTHFGGVCSILYVRSTWSMIGGGENGANAANALIESIVFNAVNSTLSAAVEANGDNTADALRESIVKAVTSSLCGAGANGGSTADALRESVVRAVTLSLVGAAAAPVFGANAANPHLSYHDAREKKEDGLFEESYDEVKRLLHIKDDPVYSAALEEWDRKEKYLTKRVDRREKRSQDLTNQIYNIIGFFSVFQGVVLTAVSQLTASNRPTCGKIWFPIVLSVFSAAAATVGVWLKFTSLKAVEKTRHDDHRAQQTAAGRQDRLRGSGRSFLFHKQAKGVVVNPGSAKAFREDKFSVIFAVLAFTVIIILSYFVILCDKWVIKGWDKPPA